MTTETNLKLHDYITNDDEDIVNVTNANITPLDLCDCNTEDGEKDTIHAFVYKGATTTIPIDVKYVRVSSQVKEIPSTTFEDLKWLEDVDFTEATHLETIGTSAFSECIKLRHLDLTGAVALKQIGDKAFNRCQSLHTVRVGPSVIYIGKRAFAENLNLQNLDLAQATCLKEIQNEAFRSCVLLSAVKLPSGLETIHYRAFQGCSRLLKVEVNAHLCHISHHVFFECKMLEAIDLHKAIRLKSIGARAFARCISLKTVRLPSGVISIGGWAFAACEALTGIHLNDGLKVIAMGCFSPCASLTEVTIPSSVTNFSRCFPAETTSSLASSLERIVVRGPTNFPLLLRISVLYPTTAPQIDMDRWLYLYSFDRMLPSEIMEPKPGLLDFLASGGSKGEKARLKEIQVAYAEAVRRLLQWSVGRGTLPIELDEPSASKTS